MCGSREGFPSGCLELHGCWGPPLEISFAYYSSVFSPVFYFVNPIGNLLGAEDSWGLRAGTVSSRCTLV